MNDTHKTLTHYGVLGMRWGIRKDSGSSSGTDSSKKDFRYLKKNEIRKTSSEELDTYVKRMQLEEKYTTLANKNSILNKGETVLKSVLAVGGTGYAVAKSPIGKIIGTAVDAALASKGYRRKTKS